jgi:hypothetical protein
MKQTYRKKNMTHNTHPMQALIGSVTNEPTCGKNKSQRKEEVAATNLQFILVNLETTATS